MNKSASVMMTALLAAAVAAAQSGGPPAGPHSFGGRGFGVMGMEPFSRTTVAGAPYSAVQTVHTEQILTDGNQIVRDQSTKVYRDSQGRVRMERTFTPEGGTARTTVAIFDPVSGSSFVLDPEKMTAVKSAVPNRRPDWANRRTSHPNNQQRQKVSLGTQTMNGLAATGERMTQTIPVGAIGNTEALQIVREVWTSVDLKIPVMIKTSDPRFGTTTMQLTNVTQSEPDASLFAVPSSYSVTTRTRPGGAALE